MQIPISVGKQWDHRPCLRQFKSGWSKSSPSQKKNPFIIFSSSELITIFFLAVQVICLGLVGQDCTTVHVVQNGDSCPTIASQANITDGQLLTDNPNIDSNCTNIYVGEVQEFLFSSHHV